MSNKITKDLVSEILRSKGLLDGIEDSALEKFYNTYLDTPFFDNTSNIERDAEVLSDKLLNLSYRMSGNSSGDDDYMQFKSLDRKDKIAKLNSFKATPIQENEILDLNNLELELELELLMPLLTSISPLQMLLSEILDTTNSNNFQIKNLLKEIPFEVNKLISKYNYILENSKDILKSYNKWHEKLSSNGDLKANAISEVKSRAALISKAYQRWLTYLNSNYGAMPIDDNTWELLASEYYARKENDDTLGLNAADLWLQDRLLDYYLDTIFRPAVFGASVSKAAWSAVGSLLLFGVMCAGMPLQAHNIIENATDNEVLDYIDDMMESGYVLPSDIERYRKTGIGSKYCYVPHSGKAERLGYDGMSDLLDYAHTHPASALSEAIGLGGFTMASMLVGAGTSRLMTKASPKVAQVLEEGMAALGKNPKNVLKYLGDARHINAFTTAAVTGGFEGMTEGHNAEKTIRRYAEDELNNYLNDTYNVDNLLEKFRRQKEALGYSQEYIELEVENQRAKIIEDCYNNDPRLQQMMDASKDHAATAFWTTFIANSAINGIIHSAFTNTLFGANTSDMLKNHTTVGRWMSLAEKKLHLEPEIIIDKTGKAIIKDAPIPALIVKTGYYMVKEPFGEGLEELTQTYISDFGINPSLYAIDTYIKALYNKEAIEPLSLITRLMDSPSVLTNLDTYNEAAAGFFYGALSSMLPMPGKMRRATGRTNFFSRNFAKDKDEEGNITETNAEYIMRQASRFGILTGILEDIDKRKSIKADVEAINKILNDPNYKERLILNGGVSALALLIADDNSIQDEFGFRNTIQSKLIMERMLLSKVLGDLKNQLREQLKRLVDLNDLSEEEIEGIVRQMKNDLSSTMEMENKSQEDILNIVKENAQTTLNTLDMIDEELEAVEKYFPEASNNVKNAFIFNKLSHQNFKKRFESVSKELQELYDNTDFGSESTLSEDDLKFLASYEHLLEKGDDSKIPTKIKELYDRIQEFLKENEEKINASPRSIISKSAFEKLSSEDKYKLIKGTKWGKDLAGLITIQKGGTYFLSKLYDSYLLEKAIEQSGNSLNKALLNPEYFMNQIKNSEYAAKLKTIKDVLDDYEVTLNNKSKIDSKQAFSVYSNSINAFLNTLDPNLRRIALKYLQKSSNENIKKFIDNKKNKIKFASQLLQSKTFKSLNKAEDINTILDILDIADSKGIHYNDVQLLIRELEVKGLEKNKLEDIIGKYKEITQEIKKNKSINDNVNKLRDNVVKSNINKTSPKQEQLLLEKERNQVYNLLSGFKLFGEASEDNKKSIIDFVYNTPNLQNSKNSLLYDFCMYYLDAIGYNKNTIDILSSIISDLDFSSISKDKLISKIIDKLEENNVESDPISIAKNLLEEKIKLELLELQLALKTFKDSSMKLLYSDATSLNDNWQDDKDDILIFSSDNIFKENMPPAFLDFYAKYIVHYMLSNSSRLNKDTHIVFLTDSELEKLARLLNAWDKPIVAAIKVDKESGTTLKGTDGTFYLPIGLVTSRSLKTLRSQETKPGVNQISTLETTFTSQNPFNVKFEPGGSTYYNFIDILLDAFATDKEKEEFNKLTVKLKLESPILDRLVEIFLDRGNTKKSETKDGKDFTGVVYSINVGEVGKEKEFNYFIRVQDTEESDMFKALKVDNKELALNILHNSPIYKNLFDRLSSSLKKLYEKDSIQNNKFNAEKAIANIIGSVGSILNVLIEGNTVNKLEIDYDNSSNSFSLKLKSKLSNENFDILLSIPLENKEDILSESDMLNILKSLFFNLNGEPRRTLKGNSIAKILFTYNDIEAARCDEKETSKNTSKLAAKEIAIKKIKSLIVDNRISINTSSLKGTISAKNSSNNISIKSPYQEVKFGVNNTGANNNPSPEYNSSTGTAPTKRLAIDPKIESNKRGPKRTESRTVNTLTTKSTNELLDIFDNIGNTNIEKDEETHSYTIETPEGKLITTTSVTEQAKENQTDLGDLKIPEDKIITNYGQMAVVFGTLLDNEARAYFGNISEHLENKNEDDPHNFKKVYEDIKNDILSVLKLERIPNSDIHIITEDNKLRLVSKYSKEDESGYIGGTMDMVVVCNGHVFIYDFKTKRSNLGDKLSDTQVKSYLQLVNLYKEMLSKNYNIDPSTIHTRLLLFNGMYDDPNPKTGNYYIKQNDDGKFVKIDNNDLKLIINPVFKYPESSGMTRQEKYSSTGIPLNILILGMQLSNATLPTSLTTSQTNTLDKKEDSTVDSNTNTNTDNNEEKFSMEELEAIERDMNNGNSLENAKKAALEARKKPNDNIILGINDDDIISADFLDTLNMLDLTLNSDELELNSELNKLEKEECKLTVKEKAILYLKILNIESSSNPVADLFEAVNEAFEERGESIVAEYGKRAFENHLKESNSIEDFLTKVGLNSCLR